MKFVKVQIPYRGGIPIINRRGPLASVELDVDTIKKLMEYGIEMLDPGTGKPIKLDEEPTDAKAVEEVATEQEEEKSSEKAAEPNADMTPAAPEVEAEKTEAHAVETPADEPEKKEEVPETATEDDADEAVDGADAFDYARISNYSSLSRSKKKELRKYFAEHTGKMDINILYANLNAMAKK